MMMGASGDPVPAKAIVYLTNRFNVLHILGSGFLGPRSWYQKYYTDLMDWSPVRLPVFEGLIPPAASELVSAESDAAFPVAVELTPEAIADNELPTLTDAAVETGLSGGHAWRALACAGCFPIADVRRIHFRTREDLEEFEAREYENIPQDVVPRVVSPELFAGPSLTSDRLRTWLEQLPKEGGLSSEAFWSVDRLLGALNAIAAVCTGRVEELEWLRCLMTGSDMRSKSEAPIWISRQTLRGEPIKPQRGIPGSDRALFPVATAILRRVHPEKEWRPLEIITEIEERLKDVGLSKRDRADLDKALKRAASLVRNEVAFRPFKAGSGMPAAKALIMVLMRPDPQELLVWPPEESGADLQTRLAAAALVGSLWGHTRLSTRIRSASMDRFLSAVGLVELGQDAGNERVRRYAPVVVTIQMDDTAKDNRSISLLWQGEDVLTRPLIDGSLRQLCQAADPATLAAVCERLGWSDCVHFTIEFRGEVSAVQTSHPDPQTTVVVGHGIPTLKLAADKERVTAKLHGLTEDSVEGRAIRAFLNESATRTK